MGKDLELLKSYTTDCERHAADCIFIRDHNTSQILPLNYNPPQKILHTVSEKQLADMGIVRVLLLKSRRFGGSTYVQGRFYSKTSLDFNRNTFIVGHERESTRTLFEMAKLMQERNPIAPATRASNEQALKFDNKQGTGLKSEYRLASAENVDAGRSQGVHFLHDSEEAFWRDPRTLLTGLMQCLPDPPAYSEAFRESTANGYGNPFQEDVFKSYGEGEHIYYEARLSDVLPHMPDSDVMFPFAWRQPGTDWVLVFVPWFAHDRYIRAFDSDNQRDEFETKTNEQVFDPDEMEWIDSEAKKLQDKYCLTLEQLHWREWAIENKCNGDIRKFRQEYPATVEEAFLSTGTNVYPKELCDTLEANCETPIIVGDVVLRNGQPRIRRNKHGKFRMWEKPDNYEQYFVTCDSGGGQNQRQKDDKTDPDPTCIDVWNHRTGKQVAQWHGHIEYDMIADIVEMAGTMYNHAMACVEIRNHGYTVVAGLKRKKYPQFERRPQEPGWDTNLKTKPIMVDDLYKMCRDAQIHIKSKQTVSEMRTFIEENGKYGAASGCHDDRVDSAGMATQMFRLIPRRLFDKDTKGDPQTFGFSNISRRYQQKDEGYQEYYTK